MSILPRQLDAHPRARPGSHEEAGRERDGRSLRRATFRTAFLGTLLAIAGAGGYIHDLIMGMEEIHVARRRGGIKKVRKVMREYKRGSLKSSSGSKVKEEAGDRDRAQRGPPVGGADSEEAGRPRRNRVQAAKKSRVEESRHATKRQGDAELFDPGHRTERSAQVADVLVSDDPTSEVRYLAIDTGGGCPGARCCSPRHGSAASSPRRNGGGEHREEADQGVAALRPRRGHSIECTKRACTTHYGYPYYWQV